jgi:hypothetical protein
VAGGLRRTARSREGSSEHGWDEENPGTRSDDAAVVIGVPARRERLAEARPGSSGCITRSAGVDALLPLDWLPPALRSPTTAARTA